VKEANWKESLGAVVPAFFTPVITTFSTWSAVLVTVIPSTILSVLPLSEQLEASPEQLTPAVNVA
jgi:hypothetical protein